VSLGETQAIFQELERIVALLERVDLTSTKLERELPQITAVVITTQQALRLFWRLTSLMRKMGLPEDVANAIDMINAVARAATYAYYAMNLLSLGTPYGTIAGIIGLVSVGLISIDSIGGYI